MNASPVALARASDARRHGGKASGLAAAIRSGVRVPDGLVLPAAALQADLERAGLAGRADALFASAATSDDAELAHRCAELRARLLALPVPPSLIETLGRRIGFPLAVRSSAVGEDAADRSFAGQFSSVNDVRDLPSLARAVRDVQASLFEPHALRYGAQRGGVATRMAVLVQRQVEAVVSGVLFTRDPAPSADAGDDAFVLEFCEGLSVDLVAGHIVPKRLRIDRVDRTVTAEDAESEALAREHAAAFDRLVDDAVSLESLRRVALDVEWCVDADERVSVVQCRPATGGAAPEHWSNANIAENYPDPVVPMLASFAARGYAGYFRGLALAFGVSRRRVDAERDTFDALVGLQGGRLYYNVSRIVRALHLVPGGAWLASAFDRFTGTRGAPPPSTRRSPVERLARARDALRLVATVPWRFVRIESGVRRFEARVDAYAARSAPATLPDRTRAELGSLLARFLEIRTRCWTEAALADAAALIAYSALKTVLDRCPPDVPATDDDLQHALLQGLPGLASARPVEALWDVATLARTDPAAVAVLRDGPADEVRGALARRAPTVAAAFETWLDTWGFRYSGELLLERPTPAEDPLPVVRLLRTYLASDTAGPAAVSARRAAVRERATAALEARLVPVAPLRRLPLPHRAGRLRVALGATQGAIRLRERARMKQALLYTRLRHVALALGDHLVRDATLAHRDDVFQLTIDEAIALAATSDGLRPEEAHALRASIAERRARRDADRATAPPDELRLRPGDTWRPERSDTPGAARATGAAFEGTGACAGDVTGTASVVLDVADIDTVAPDAILVTRQTDPGWAPVFFLTSGLVVERGGMLSHGAIIAREYGIPAVVGVPDVTRRVASGERLHVDGTRGVVTRCA